MGHTGYVTCLAVLGDGVSLASGSSDNTVRLWKTKTGVCTHVLEGHTHNVMCLAVLGDGASLASGSEDETVRVWNTKTGVYTHVLEGHTSWVCLAVLSDGSILSGAENSTVKLWKRNKYMTPLLLMCMRRSKKAAQFVCNISYICRAINNYYFSGIYT